MDTFLLIYDLLSTAQLKTHLSVLAKLDNKKYVLIFGAKACLHKFLDYAGMIWLPKFLDSCGCLRYGKTFQKKQSLSMRSIRMTQQHLHAKQLRSAPWEN